MTLSRVRPQSLTVTSAPLLVSQQKDVVKPFLSASEPPAKRRRRDSPLEEAILKELHGDMEAQSSVSVLG